MKALALVLALAAASVATARADVQTDAEKSFREGVQTFFDERSARIERASTTASGPVAGDRASARSQALDDDGAGNIGRRASAAIKTDLEDVEAGLQVAPLVLAGRNSAAARAWNVSVAALEGTQFRIATAYRLAFDELAVGPDDLDVGECKLDEVNVRGTLDGGVTDFGTVCQAVAANAAATDDWRDAAAACGIQAGLQPDQDEAYRAIRDGNVYAKLSALSLFVTTTTACGGVSTCDDAFKRIEVLRTGPASRFSCLTEADFEAALTKHQWKERHHGLGFSASVDFFPITGGFEVESGTGNAGITLAKASGSAEYRHSNARMTWGLGLGGEMSREAAGDDPRWALKANASVGFVVTRLDGGDLTDADGRIILVDGKLPPLLSIGLDLAAAVPLDPDDKHDKTLDLLAFDAMSATIFADLRFTDELAVRIGVPFTREAATRESDGKRALVWTLPVFVTTVLAL